MRVAAIYDIHGNLPALEAVLEEIRRADVDKIVVGGDVMPGPMVRETLERLLELDVPAQFICGNCEVAVLEQMAGKDPAAVPERYRPAIRWTAEELSEYRELIAGWPKTLRMEIPGLGDVLFCHATPRNEDECFTRLTSEDRLRPVFDGLGAAVVICGHTHMQFDRRVGATRVVNAGSVGMPFGGPGADWLLLGPDEAHRGQSVVRGLNVELRHTPYDFAQAAEMVRGTSYPDAEEFASQYVLQPPSEDQMLEVFSRVELK